MAVEISITVITTLITSTPTLSILPSKQQLPQSVGVPSFIATTAIAASFHPIYQYRQDSDDDDTVDDWKYALRLYTCGYCCGNYEAIRPPSGEICVLDLRDGLYEFCNDPGENKLDLKRDCSEWRGGCLDAFGCKEANQCGAVGVRERGNVFLEVEICTGNNPYRVISKFRFSASASDSQVYRCFGCNAYPTTIDYLATPHTAPPLATATATSDFGEGGSEGRESPSSSEQQQTA